MKITAISDQHGALPEIDPCDLLIIAGDILPVYGHEPHKQRNWFRNVYKPWLEGIEAEKIIGIAGNHDFIFESESWVPRAPDIPWEYLCDQGAEYEGLKIWGSPWIPMLKGWAFYKDDSERREAWKLIPDDIDILITHGPPYEIRDLSVMSNVHSGCPLLQSEILYRIEPRIHVFGHIHEGHGIERLEGVKTEFANVAILNEKYQRVHEPTTLVLT